MRHPWLAGAFLASLAMQAQSAPAQSAQTQAGVAAPAVPASSAAPGAPAASSTASPAAPASAPVTKARKSPSKGERQAEIWFNMLDSNKDGYLSWPEIKHIAPLAKDFKAADTDANGLVSRDEIRILSRQRKAERRARKAAQAKEKAGQAANKPGTTP